MPGLRWNWATEAACELANLMRFDTDARPAELPAFLRTLVEIPGADAWRQRHKDFTIQIRDNPLIERYLDSRFKIERDLSYVRNYRDKTGRWPAVLSSVVDLGALYSFAAMLTRVYRRLPPCAQHALKRKMIGALKDNVGLAPIVFELRAAAHFMRAGFEVDFHDLCGGGGYDFLVRRGDIEMEVECKSVSGDLGRKVHLLRQYQLGRELFRLMISGAKQGTVRLAVATLSDRLFGERKFMEDVARAIGAALDSAASVAEAAPCTVNYYEFPIESSPFHCPSPPQIDEEDVVAYCERAVGYSVGPLIMVFAPKNNATVVAIRSSKPDEFLMGVYRNLKEGAKRQLSRTKAGVLCVQFSNLTSEQLRNVAGDPAKTGRPTALQMMTNKFFDSDERVHVHTISYTAPGPFTRRDYLIGAQQVTHINENAASYTFTNKNHPNVDDRRFRIF